jgi:hypothetical protein
MKDTDKQEQFFKNTSFNKKLFLKGGKNFSNVSADTANARKNEIACVEE